MAGIVCQLQPCSCVNLCRELCRLTQQFHNISSSMMNNSDVKDIVIVNTFYLMMEPIMWWINKVCTQLIHLTVLWYMHVHTLIFGTHVYMYMHVCNTCAQCSSVMHFGYYALILCTCMCDQKMHIPVCKLVPYWFGVSLSELCVDGISVCMYVCNTCMYVRWSFCITF